MLIALRHNLHGTHIAYSDLEAIECEKNGWRRDRELSLALSGNVATPTPTPTPAPASASEPKPVSADVQPVTLAEQYEAKFGKKPHHKMLPATIQAALDEK